MAEKKLPIVEEEGLAFIAKLKDRNQITIDSSIIKMLGLDNGDYVNVVVVDKK